MDRVVLVARLRPDARERAQELATGKTASVIDEIAFDRIAIFLSVGEVVFLLEGHDVDRSIGAILNDPVSSTAISPWIPLFDGPLHRVPEAYAWERAGSPAS